MPTGGCHVGYQVVSCDPDALNAAYAAYWNEGVGTSIDTCTLPNCGHCAGDGYPADDYLPPCG